MEGVKVARALAEPVRLTDVDVEGRLLGDEDCETEAEPLCEAD